MCKDRADMWGMRETPYAAAESRDPAPPSVAAKYLMGGGGAAETGNPAETPAGVYKMSQVGGEDEVGQDGTRIGTVNYSWRRG